MIGLLERPVTKFDGVGEAGKHRVWIVLQVEGGVVQALWAKSSEAEAVALAERIAEKGGFDPQDDDILVIEAEVDGGADWIWAWPPKE